MSRLSSLHPGLTGILPLADAMWTRARQPHEKFYGLWALLHSSHTLHFLPPAIRAGACSDILIEGCPSIVKLAED